ncbi:MAG TPA: hypothetical protein EYG50_10455, partial [Cycloclasticus sp.]|nr:hypothetical protein [Cycloclasticus sp.]
MAKPKIKAKPSRKKPARRNKKKPSSGLLKRSFIKLSLLLLAVLAAYVVYLDYTVRTQFEGKRWALPAHVFAN